MKDAVLAADSSGFAGQRHLRLLVAACGAAVFLCVLLAVRLDRTTADLRRRTERAAGLAADATAIRQLRDMPRQASEAGLPQDDVLSQVAAAMKAAQIDPTQLVATQPQPPRKVLGTQQAEVTHRLTFENVRLEPLIRFGYELTSRNPALRVTAMQLRAGAEKSTWGADISVGYLVLSLESAGDGH